MHRKRNCLILSLVLLCGFELYAQETGKVPELGIFHHAGGNLFDSFIGVNTLLHAGGFASTWLLAANNIDYRVHHYFYERPALSTFFAPVTLSGILVPVSAVSILWLSDDREWVNAGNAVLQSLIISLSYVSILKSNTGRPHPDYENESAMETESRRFDFGFFRSGIFWGWPSGHTAATMAVVSTLTSYFDDVLWLKIAGSALMVYTVIGVSAAHKGSMHWFSDGVAAALMTYAIGSTVGSNYRRAMKEDISSAYELRVLPLLSGDSLGLQAALNY